ncbi:hypothetical protein ACRN93_15215 [Shewanella baltica]|uniref:hypothetical protein n=1 Tax=Shewanella baltica TaxID=62322 RepID=UPI003D7C04E5
MSKLSNMQEWFTLDYSASYLSNILGEQVLKTDLYRLALDKKITLSVRFLESVPALIGKLVDEHDFFTQTSNQTTDDNRCDLSELCNSSDLFSPIDTHDSSEPVDDDKWFIFEDIAQNINGVWDLTMLGLESVDLEKRYLDELGECGYNPQRHKEEGIFIRNDASVCKLLTKLDPSPVYEDNAFVGGIIKDFFEREAISYDECINNDFDTLASLLTFSQLDHVTTIIDAMSVSFPTYKLYKNCLTIEDYDYQMVIKKQEIDRFIQSFEEIPKESTSQEASSVRDEERTALLVLIEVLCNKVNIDPKQRGIALSLVTMVGLIGSSLSDDTIRKIVNQIEPVVCSKSKAQLTRTLTTNERNSFLVLIAALCGDAKLDYKGREAIAVLVNMSKENGTPLLNERISTILSQIETAICSKTK